MWNVVINSLDNSPNSYLNYGDKDGDSTTVVMKGSEREKEERKREMGREWERERGDHIKNDEEEHGWWFDTYVKVLQNVHVRFLISWNITFK